MRRGSLSGETVEDRKLDHLRIVMSGEAERRGALFDRVYLLHKALPRVALQDVDTSVEFLGYSLDTPMFIAAMTGGAAGTEQINRRLADVAQSVGMALFLGSMRPAIEKGLYPASYAMKGFAPDVPVIGNIGLQDFMTHYEKVESFSKDMGFDAIAIHMNALQEAIQREGNHTYSFDLSVVRERIKEFGLPVIFKETGAGVDYATASTIKSLGAAYLDVSGRGGTSWSAVEMRRGGGPPGFEEWGIPTVLSLLACKGVLPLLASGGVRSGIDGAKALALGAEMFGAAAPFLVNPRETAELWLEQLRIAMFLTDSPTVREIRGKYYAEPSLFELVRQIKGNR